MYLYCHRHFKLSIDQTQNLYFEMCLVTLFIKLSDWGQFSLWNVGGNQQIQRALTLTQEGA